MVSHFIPLLSQRRDESAPLIVFMNSQGEYRSLSYSDLWNRILQAAACIHTKTVSQQEPVLIMLDTQEEFLHAFFACHVLHAIPVAYASPKLQTHPNEWMKQLRVILKELNIKKIITDTSIKKILNPHLEDIQWIEAEEWSESTQKYVIPSLESYQSDEICFLQLSSGTTSIPKAIQITHANVFYNTTSIVSALNPENKPYSIASWLPLYHDMGLVGCLLLSIVNHSLIVLLKPHDFIRRPILWLKAISDYKIYTITAPNFAYRHLMKMIQPSELKEIQLNSLQTALCGAENVGADTARSVTQFLEYAGLDRKSFMPVYGLAEATLAVTFTPRREGVKTLKVDELQLRNGKVVFNKKGVEICSVGFPLEGFTLQIMSPDGHVLGEKEIGEVSIQGPSVTLGYYHAPDKNAELFRQGFLRTGDEGFIFEGELYLCGRIKEVIIVQGKKVYPYFIEESLSEINGLKKGRVIVTSRYDSQLQTDRAVVLAEIIEEQKIDSVQIQKLIEDKIATYQILLDKVILLKPGSLLKTSSGKIRRKESLKYWYYQKTEVKQ